MKLILTRSSNHNSCKMYCFHILVPLFLALQYLPMQFFRYLYMLKFHKYLFSFWTSCRWLLEYPVTQIWIFHLIEHFVCDSHPPRYIFDYCRLLQSYQTTWPTVLYFFTFWTSYRSLLSFWIFWFPDVDLVTPWNYSKIVSLVTHTHTHTMFLSLGGTLIIELHKFPFLDCLL